MPYQSRSSWSATPLFTKSSSCSSKIGEMYTFSLNFSEQKTDGAKINNLAALQFNLLKLRFISEINVWATGMTSVRLKYSSGELAGTFSQ